MKQDSKKKECALMASSWDNSDATSHWNFVLVQLDIAPSTETGMSSLLFNSTYTNFVSLDGRTHVVEESRNAPIVLGIV